MLKWSKWRAMRKHKVNTQDKEAMQSAAMRGNLLLISCGSSPELISTQSYYSRPRLETQLSANHLNSLISIT